MSKAQNILLIAGGLLLITMRSSAKSFWSQSGEQIPLGMMGKYFSVDEVTYSATAAKYHIEAQFNPPSFVWEAAYLLTYYVLDPIRAWLGTAVNVESWYRSQELTDKLLKLGEDTVKNTTHVTGGTADLTVVIDGVNRSGLIVRAALVLHIPFDRLLIEHGTLDAPNHIHIEYDPLKSPDQQRRQIWRITNGHHGQQKSIAWAEEQYL